MQEAAQAVVMYVGKLFLRSRRHQAVKRNSP